MPAVEYVLYLDGCSLHDSLTDELEKVQATSERYMKQLGGLTEENERLLETIRQLTSDNEQLNGELTVTKNTLSQSAENSLRSDHILA